MTTVDGDGEITGQAMSVTFVGTGTLTITFSSNGGSNTSNFGLIDANGNFIAATSYTSNVAGSEVVVSYFGDNAANVVYQFTGSGNGTTLVFDITEAGTYYFFSYYTETKETTDADGNVTGTSTSTRGCRIKAAEMVDCYVDDEDEAEG